MPGPFVRATRFCFPGRLAITALLFFWRVANSILKLIWLRHTFCASAGGGVGSKAAGPGVRWMRDPTRGGVATSLNELARDCGLGIVLVEEMIPMQDAVRGACELLGLDPLHIANEGQFLAVVAPEYADAALNALSLARAAKMPRSSARCVNSRRRRSSHDALWWQPNCGHAGRRPAAADLLETYLVITDRIRPGKASTDCGDWEIGA